jgi:hypothetical protein
MWRQTVWAMAVLLCATSSGAWAQNPSDATNRATEDAVRELRDHVQRALQQQEEQLKKDRITKEQVTEGRVKAAQPPQSLSAGGR